MEISVSPFVVPLYGMDLHTICG